MEFIIISGMSGAGKSSAAAFLEDLGFYCVDNMPVALITNFAGLCMAGAGTGNAVKNNQALSLAMAAFTRARVSSLPSMAARSVPPPGVR